MVVEPMAVPQPVGRPEVRGLIVVGAAGLQHLSPEAVSCVRFDLSRGLSGFDEQSPWPTTALLLAGVSCRRRR